MRVCVDAGLSGDGAGYDENESVFVDVVADDAAAGAAAAAAANADDSSSHIVVTEADAGDSPYLPSFHFLPRHCTATSSSHCTPYIYVLSCSHTHGYHLTGIHTHTNTHTHTQLVAQWLSVSVN